MEKSKKKVVGISLYPPLIIQDENTYTGFEIELWEKIAKALSINFTYKKIKFKNLLENLKNKQIDVAVAGISMTEEREKIIDFSHFTLRSGLLILISKKIKRNVFGSLKNIIAVNYKNLAYVSLLTFFLILFFAHVIWFIERGGGAFDYSYVQGLGEAFWWTVVTISTVGYGDFVPQTIAGRLVGTFTIIIGFCVFGLFIAKLTSLFTVKAMKYKIESYKDLKGKKVATKVHTIAVDQLFEMGAKVTAVSEIERAYTLLEKGKVDAVVFDSHVIQHFLQNQKNEKFVSVGDIFAPHMYGMATQSNNKMRDLINREILRLMESGEYDALHKKWFGEEWVVD